MYNYVINCMDKNNTTYKYQFEFRKNHSTQHAIITLVDRILFRLLIEIIILLFTTHTPHQIV